MLTRTAFLISLAVVAPAADRISIPGIPADLGWKNVPVRSAIEGNKLSIQAGKSTDWYISPLDRKQSATAPILLFEPARDFVLIAKVTVDFRTQWDAGALFVYSDEKAWAKFAFENSIENKPTIVTVVTRAVSDDCNSWSISGNSVWLKIARIGETFGLYASEDGRKWQMVRVFTFGTVRRLQVGFEAQSPVGTGATAVFSDISYNEKRISNIFSGQ